MTKPDLMAELAEVVAQLRSYDDKSIAGVRLSTLSESAVNFIRTHHAELEAVVRSYRAKVDSNES